MGVDEKRLNKKVLKNRGLVVLIEKRLKKIKKGVDKLIGNC